MYRLLLGNRFTMKRFLCILGILIGGYLPVRSQPNVSVGPILAPFSSYAGEPRDFEASFRYGTGISMGVQAQVDLSQKWSLASGFWYETASVKAGDGLFSGASRTKQRHVAIPLLLNFRPANRTVSPYFSAGTLLVAQQGQRMPTARALFAAGLSYRVAPRLSVNVQPALTLGANSETDRVFYPRNRQLSLQTQLLYRFSTRTHE